MDPITNPDGGAGAFRSMSPPARIQDNPDHDTGMLNTPGHTSAPADTGVGVTLGGGSAPRRFRLSSPDEYSREY